MSQFSTTRLTDRTTALGANVYLGQAVNWLRSHTPMSNMSELEVYEALLTATSGGPFVITYNTHAVP